MSFVEKFIEAAQEHAANTGESDRVVGDLEVLLDACWAVLTREQKERVVDSEAFEELRYLPEYAAVDWQVLIEPEGGDG